MFLVSFTEGLGLGFLLPPLRLKSEQPLLFEELQLALPDEVISSVGHFRQREELEQLERNVMIEYLGTMAARTKMISVFCQPSYSKFTY